MTHASVFSGIGGPEVAATMLGWDNLFHCEINPFGRSVLDYWYPNAKSYDDITKTDFSEWRGKIDVLTGGFPCQPFSYAGQRRGSEDDRYLWPYMFKCINAIRPTWFVAENVAGILSMVEQGQVSAMETQVALFGEEDTIHRYRLAETFTIERICHDLESHGYSVQPVLVPACAVGAPHRRDRVFIVGRRTDDGNECHSEENASGRITGPIPKDPLRSRQLHGQHDQQGHQRDERHTGAGSGERLCNQTPGSAPTDTEEQCSERMRPQQSDTCREEQKQFGRECCQDGSVRRADADTADAGLQGRHDSHTQGHEQSEDGCTRQPGEVYGREQYDTHTDNAGLQETRPEQSAAMPWRTHIRNGEWYKIDERSAREAGCGRWSNFPTVSPVHRGNDGLPFNVDDLTLSPSKWRTESLKAYGNAIVPQVMYEIFRAIQITEEQIKFN